MNKRAWLNICTLGFSEAKLRAAERQEAFETQINSFKGAHKSKVILEWGPPTSVHSDGKDGEILVYANSTTVGGTVCTNTSKSGIGNNSTYANSSGFYTAPIILRHRWLFYTNSKGLIHTIIEESN